MTFSDSVAAVFFIPPAFYAGYRVHRQRTRLKPNEPQPPTPATHVQIVCPICHDRIMVPTSSVASEAYLIRRDDLDIQAHMLTHPETR